MPMLLKSEDGPEFELAIIEDRFDDPQDGFGDAGWLTLAFRVATEDETWEETAPCMNTFEIKHLAEWMEGVLGRQPDLGSIELLEPELSFEVVEEKPEEVTLRVGFHLADRPREFEVDAPTDEADHVDLRVQREVLRAAVNELESDIELLELSGKDDLTGAEEPGMVRPPDDDLDMIDQIEDTPPGAGAGEDNAGNR